MFADGLLATHNGTGGAGTLTLAAVSGSPQPTNAFGTSGTLFVDYQIAEYTDATFATLLRMETGIGSLNLSTNVLTRTQPNNTWTSGGSYNMSNPTALTFGATAANIRITFGGASDTQKRGLNSTFSVAGNIWSPFNTRITWDSSTSSFTVTNGFTLFIPVEFIYTKPISQVGVYVNTAVAATNLRVGLYDWDTATGGPVNLLTEFTSGGAIATTATGYRAVSLATPYQAPPGFYWICIQADNSTVALARFTHQGNGLIGDSASRDLMMFDKTGTYGALPATGPTSAGSLYSRSAGGQVGVFFK